MPPPMRLTGTSSVDDEAARVARTLDRKEVETESPLRVLQGEFREGDTVDVGFPPSDCVLLGEDDRRLT